MKYMCGSCCLPTLILISLPTYPKFCWYATGTTHIIHLGLSDI